MSTEEQDERPTLVELMALRERLGNGVQQVEAEVVHMVRQRRLLAWGALFLAAASAASLFMAEGLVQIVFQGMQLALWAFAAVLNFSGPPLSEWLAMRGKR